MTKKRRQKEKKTSDSHCDKRKTKEEKKTDATTYAKDPSVT